MPFQWPAEFAFGISEIDHVHQKIFQRINLLLESCENGKGTEQLDKMLAFFQKELVSQFETEEALMKARNYPDRHRHQQAHASFLRRVRHLQKEIEESENGHDALTAFNEVVIDWLFEHACMEDRALGDFIRAPGTVARTPFPTPHRPALD